MQKHHHIASAALLLALLAYYLPWVYHPAASLSPGARDLAEWTTLLPAMRTGTFPLVASFLLRMSFGALVTLVAWLASHYKPVIVRLAIIGVAFSMILTMLPPVEFFISAGADPNYQQQFFLSLTTLVALIAGLVAWHRSSTRIITLTPVITAFVAVVCALVGLGQGVQLLRATPIEASIGPGVVLFVAALLVMEVQELRASRTLNKQ